MATETGRTGSTYDGRLFELYTKYVSEPESKQDVYGYTLLLVGYVFAFGGMLLFLGGTSGAEPNTSTYYFFTQYGGGPAAIGLVLTLLGIVLLLPVTRRALYFTIFGTAIALAAVGAFFNYYPLDWTQGEAYSQVIIALYTFGIGIVASVVIMIPVVTGERSYFSETTVGHEYDHPDIMIGESDRGGLFAVFKRSTEWTWRFIDQHAVAGSTTDFLSKLEAEERVEAVKEQVESAGLLEIKHAAFRLYESAEDTWQWYLMRDDGTAVAEGGSDYDDRDAAEDAINAMKDHGPEADVFVMENAAYDVYREDGEWGWRLIDEDRTPLGVGVSTHTEREAAIRGLEQFRELAQDAIELVIEAYGIELVEDEGAWHWRLRDSTHRQLANSITEYDTKGTAEDAVYDMLDRLQRASILEADQPTLDVYQSDGAWRWRFVDESAETAALGRHDADSPETASNAAHELRAHSQHADVVEMDDLEFETYRSGGAWHWRLVTSDREVRAESTESYESEDEASGIVDRVREEAPDADLIEFDNAAFQVYEAEGGAWRWRLIDEDGNVLADSGQGEYESKEDATGAMVTLQERAPEAEHLEIENAAFELFQDDDGWGYRLVDDIGDTIAEGGQRHDTEDGARDAMNELIDTVDDTDERRMEHGIFQVYHDEDDEWWWRFVLPEGTILADGPESFGTRHAAEDAVEEIAEQASDAPVETVGRLAVLLDPADWSWELVDADRSTVAVGTVSHDSRADAIQAIEDVQQEATETTVYEIQDAAFDCYKSDVGWTWRLVDATHEPVARSPDTFADLGEVEDNVDGVSQIATEAEFVDYDDVAFELFRDDDGWTWRLVDEDQWVIANGAGHFETRDEVEREIDDVRTEINHASVLEIDSAAFEFNHTDDGWHWRLVDDSGTELAQSLEAFDSRAEAQEELQTIKELGPDAWTSVAE